MLAVRKKELEEFIQTDFSLLQYLQIKILKIFLKKKTKVLDDLSIFRFVGTLSLIFEVVL